MARINEDLGINLAPPSREIRSRREARRTFSEIAEQYLGRLGRGPTTYFGDKTPEHSGLVDRIKRIFPDAKYLWIYRDGRDVAHSLCNVPWMPRNLYANFLVWLFYYRKQIEVQRDTTLDVRFVRYEDFVTDPHAELRTISEFLGVEFEPGMAEGHGNFRTIPKREYPWKARALQPITTERIGVWRSELTRGQVGTLERMGRRALEALGYRLLTNGKDAIGPSLAAALVAGSLQLLFRIPMHLLTNQFLGSGLCR